jgi:hypothetical protein
MGNKDDKLSSLDLIFNRWETWLSGLSEEQLVSQGIYQENSIKEILAHLTAWQQITVARLEAARYGKDPVFPGWFLNDRDPETDEDLDAVNLSIHDLYFDHDWEEIHKEWKDRFKNVVRLAETLPVEDLEDEGKYPWLEGYPLIAVLEGTIDHHLEHLEDLLAVDGSVDNKSIHQT